MDQPQPDILSRTSGPRIVRQRTPRTAPATVKTTINLPIATATTLRELANARCTTLADTITRALSLDKFLEQAISNGGKLLIEEEDKSVKQLVLFR